MASDAAVSNNLKALTRATEEQTRVLKGLDHSMAKVVRALEALNENYVATHRRSNVEEINE